MDKKCQRCNSERIMNIYGKTSDCFNAEYSGVKYDGYVLGDIGIGDGGDDIEFSYCLECGQIQDDFPIGHHTVMDKIEEINDGENNN